MRVRVSVNVAAAAAMSKVRACARQASERLAAAVRDENIIYADG